MPATDETTLRRHIGYVIQHAGLFPHLHRPGQYRHRPASPQGQPRRGPTPGYGFIEWVGPPAALAGRYLPAVRRSSSGSGGSALARRPAGHAHGRALPAPSDPVVRGALQQEFLRLQRELGTTIALVTHDIDGAVTLGDRVAVFHGGSHLAQVRTPRGPAHHAGRRLRRLASSAGTVGGAAFLPPAGRPDPRPLPADRRSTPTEARCPGPPRLGVATASFGDGLGPAGSHLAISAPPVCRPLDATGRATGVVRPCRCGRLRRGPPSGSGAGTAAP